MAKTSILNRQKKREKLVRQYAAKRAELKRQAKDTSLTPEARMAARESLAKLPRNSSPVRLVRLDLVAHGRAHLAFGVLAAVVVAQHVARRHAVRRLTVLVLARGDVLPQELHLRAQ